MGEINFLKDASFLRQLDIENIKVYYVRILVLDKKEIPIRAIEGRVSAGSISINGSSCVRRTGNVTFLAEEKKNDLTDVDNDLIQRVLEAHKLLIPDIKSCYTVLPKRETRP